MADVISLTNDKQQVGTDQVKKKVIDVSEQWSCQWLEKKVIDDNGVDGVIVRLGYSGTGGQGIAHILRS